MTKIIILIGKTGSGKSTLANVISDTNKFKESGSSASVTKDIQKEEFIENDTKYEIIDTIGIGDSELKKEGVLDKIAEAVYLARNGISKVFFVTNGRFDQFEMSIYSLLSTIIFDKNVTNYTTIVRTKFPEFEDKEERQKDIEKMITSEGELSNIIKSCQQRVIHIDNPSLDIDAADDESDGEREEREEIINLRRKTRNKSRKKLLEHLQKKCLCLEQEKIYKPPKLQALSAEIVEFMERKIKAKKRLEEKLKEKKWKSLEEVKRKEKIRVINKQKTAVGEIENSDNKSKNISSVDSKNKKIKSNFKKENQQVVSYNDLENEETNQETEQYLERKMLIELKTSTIKKIKELKELKSLKEEIQETDRFIRWKVLDHIFNNYSEIINILGGEIFINNIIKDNADFSASKSNLLKLQEQKDELEEKLLEKWDNDQSLEQIKAKIKRKEQKLLELKKKLLNFKEIAKEWLNHRFNIQQTWEWIEIGFDIDEYREVQEWKKHKFTSAQAKEWLGIDLQPRNADYAQWLRDEKKVNASWIFKYGKKEELRIEYEKMKRDKKSFLIPTILLQREGEVIDMSNLKNIHPDFTPKLQKEWKERKFSYKECKEWIDTGLKPKDYEFVTYLRGKKNQPSPNFNLGVLKEEFNTWEKENKSTQEYLDVFYPKEKRSTIKKINIAFKNLIGNLDLKDFADLRVLDCYNNQLTSLNLGNCPKLEKFNCSNNKLTELKVDNLGNITDFQCNKNQITNLDMSNCNQLKGLRCIDNYLESLKLLSQMEQLVYLNINSNNLPRQDLSMFSRLVNLEQLYLGNWNKEKINQGVYNRFYGCLEPLKYLSKLEYLDISNTDINSGVEYLPSNWLFKSNKPQKLFYSFAERPESKVKEIAEQLTNFLEYGLCKWCKKVISEYNWCQYCNTNADLSIHDFIQKYEKLKAIPYEQFEIEKDENGNDKILGEGGFGKVYKAKWITENKVVSLKILNDSRYISEDFLQEIANHQILFNCNTIVRCHGVSQDPQTNNYLMVMDYIKGSNLKIFLQDNYLNFEDKFGNLLRIARGLNEIHNRKLVHRDFHSGNILNNQNKCYITDLGLCRPANETNKDKVYGVLPYVAPEVLQGKLYTQASDVYSFGIIAYEVLSSGLPPYCEHIDNEFLAVKICQGLRPNLDEVQAPRLLKDLIQQCWNSDSLKRPKAKELCKTIEIWQNEVKNKKNTEFTQQYQKILKIDKQNLCQALSKIYKEHKGKTKEVKPQEIEEVKKELFEEFFKKGDYKKYNKKEKVRKVKKELNKLLAKENNLTYKTHPQAIYTSRLLDFKNLPEPQNSEEINERFHKFSQSMEFDMSGLVKGLEEQTEQLKIKDWTTLYPHFAEELINQWGRQDFTPQQTHDWLNIGLQPTDFKFASWLRDIKHLTPEWVLNQGNYQQLNQEFFNWEQQSQIEQPPK